MLSESHRENLPSRIEQRIDAHLTLAERLRKHREEPAAGPSPFVTIARQYGCEAMALAEFLSNQLPGGPWPIYNRVILEKMADETPVTEKLFHALDMRARSGIEEFFEHLIGRSPTDLRVLHQLVRTERALASLGHCIIVGRGASVLTSGLPGGVHIRLIAPKSWREKNLMERFGWSKERTQEVLYEEEHGRSNFFRKYLNQDPNNPELYDLMLNSAQLTRAEEAAAVLALYRARFSH